LPNYLIIDKDFITYIVISYNHNSCIEIKNLRWSWPLKWKNRLQKVHKICAQFTKMVCRICKPEFSIFWRRILTTIVMTNVLQIFNYQTYIFMNMTETLWTICT